MSKVGPATTQPKLELAEPHFKRLCREDPHSLLTTIGSSEFTVHQHTFTIERLEKDGVSAPRIKLAGQNEQAGRLHRWLTSVKSLFLQSHRTARKLQRMLDSEKTVMAGLRAIVSKHCATGNPLWTEWLLQGAPDDEGPLQSVRSLYGLRSTRAEDVTRHMEVNDAAVRPENLNREKSGIVDGQLVLIFHDPASSLDLRFQFEPKPEAGDPESGAARLRRLLSVAQGSHGGRQYNDMSELVAAYLEQTVEEEGPAYLRNVLTTAIASGMNIEFLPVAKAVATGAAVNSDRRVRAERDREKAIDAVVAEQTKVIRQQISGYLQGVLYRKRAMPLLSHEEQRARIDFVQSGPKVLTQINKALAGGNASGEPAPARHTPDAFVAEVIAAHAIDLNTGIPDNELYLFKFQLAPGPCEWLKSLFRKPRPATGRLLLRVKADVQTQPLAYASKPGALNPSSLRPPGTKPPATVKDLARNLYGSRFDAKFKRAVAYVGKQSPELMERARLGAVHIGNTTVGELWDSIDQPPPESAHPRGLQVVDLGEMPRSPEAAAVAAMEKLVVGDIEVKQGEQLSPGSAIENVFMLNRRGRVRLGIYAAQEAPEATKRRKIAPAEEGWATLP